MNKKSEKIKIVVLSKNNSFNKSIKKLDLQIEADYYFFDNYSSELQKIIVLSPDLILLNFNKADNLSEFYNVKNKSKLNPVPLILFASKRKYKSLKSNLDEGACIIIFKSWKKYLIEAQIQAVLRMWSKYKVLRNSKYESMHLFKLTRKMHSIIAKDELISLVMKEVKNLLNVKGVNFLLFKQEPKNKDALYVDAHQNFSNTKIRSIIKNFEKWMKNLQTNSNLSEKIVLKKIKSINKKNEDPESILNLVFTNYVKTKGKLLGVINYLDNDKKEFDQEEITLVSAISQQLAVGLKNIFLFETLNHLARKDELTQLYNRRYFNERFDNEFLRDKRYGRFFSFVIIDLDDFKKINDKFGHNKGDEVLIKISEIIRKGIRKIDIAARYGGEEFILLFPETNSEKAVVSSERIRKKLSLVDFGINRQVTASFGVACSKDTPSAGKQEMIANADTALYKAKFNGKNQIIVYTPDMEK